MPYDHKDRFRNWGPAEYESKILQLESSNAFLKNREITLKELNTQLERVNHENSNCEILDFTPRRNVGS